MPTPRQPVRQVTAEASAAGEQQRTEDSNATTLPPSNSPLPQMPQPPPVPQLPNGQPPSSYAHDASGLPIIGQTPPPGMPVQLAPNVPPHLQPYAIHHPGQSRPMSAWNPQRPDARPDPQHNHRSPP